VKYSTCDENEVPFVLKSDNYEDILVPAVRPAGAVKVMTVDMRIGLGGVGDILSLEGWTRRMTGHGAIYYVNRDSQDTRWVHPGLSRVVANLSKYDNIRYAAYRLSSKLIEVGRVLGCSSVSLGLVTTVLASHGLVNPSVVLDPASLRQLLATLWYRAAPGSHASLGREEEIMARTEAMASLVEQVLDPGHVGGDAVNLLGLKTILAVLCSARLRDKLTFLFREHADHQARLWEPGLTYLLSLLARVPEILGEGVMFGSGVVARGVFSCLQAGGGRLVTEEVWMSWASREPPELVWLTTSYRQFASRQVEHQVRCSACHVQPIIGMRYQCLKCLSFDLCQSCFFVGQTGTRGGHKPSHPVQEYCYPSTRKEEARAFMATLANKLRPNKNGANAGQKQKMKRALTADRISSRASSRPSSMQSSKSSHSKLSQLLVKVSGPKSSNRNSGESVKSPRVSPRVQSLSSPRCSIGERLDKLSPVSSGFGSGGATPESGGTGADNSPAMPEYQSSPIYEEPVRREIPLEEEIVSPGLEWDDGGCELGHRSVAAADAPESEDGDDTGQTEQILEDIEKFENSIFRRDMDTGEVRCYQHNTRRHRVARRREEVDSILGHLEDGAKEIQARLGHGRAEPSGEDLVTDTQTQLGRLRSLMASMLQSRAAGLDEEDKEEDKEVTKTDRPSHLRPKSEEIDLEYTSHHDWSVPGVSPGLPLANIKQPAESTRLLDLGLAKTPRAAHNNERLMDLDILSPITSVVRSQIEREEAGIDVRGEDAKEEEVTPEKTTSCLDPDSISLTRYHLDDLTAVLGGSKNCREREELFISRDAGLELTGAGYTETMEELDNLMGRLSSLFKTFTKEEKEEFYYDSLAQSKESRI